MMIDVEIVKSKEILNVNVVFFYVIRVIGIRNKF